MPGGDGSSLTMGKKCFVPNCKSGYDSCKDKVCMFSVPKETSRLQAWRDAIQREDRVLRPGDYVCEKHFDPMYVSKTWTAMHNGVVLASTTRRAYLARDAVPTHFPATSHYTFKELCSVTTDACEALPKERAIGRKHKRKRRNRKPNVVNHELLELATDVPIEDGQNQNSEANTEQTPADGKRKSKPEGSELQEPQAKVYVMQETRAQETSRVDKETLAIAAQQSTRPHKIQDFSAASHDGNTDSINFNTLFENPPRQE